MAISDKLFYNEASASKLGWLPQWFGEREFGSELLKSIKEFQKVANLTVDGLVGPVTFRRIYTEVEARGELLRKTADPEVKFIRCGDHRVDIEWDKVVGLRGEESLALPDSCYQRTLTPARSPDLIVTHWDAALSAKSCKTILERRGISTHFVIDNDGTIYQLVDTNDIAWHAGKPNSRSIGIDFSNAFYPKYQRVYRRRNFGNRPILDDSRVHDCKIEKHLGYYTVQLEAYKALVAALSSHYNIPLECPQTDEGALLEGVSPEAVNGSFKGVVCHYHLSRKKIDCAGLQLLHLLDEIKDEQSGENDN